MVRLDSDTRAINEEAAHVTRTLGGLPLALSQISGFIVQRKISFHEFLLLYRRNATEIDARKTGSCDYGHSLSTVWEKSMGALTGDSRNLLNILPYFHPHKIDEEALVNGSVLVEDNDMSFLRDGMEYVYLRLAILQPTI